MLIKLQHACESKLHSFELAPVQGSPIQVQSQTGRISDTTIGFCCKTTMTGSVTHVLIKTPLAATSVFWTLTKIHHALTLSDIQQNMQKPKLRWASQLVTKNTSNAWCSNSKHTGERIEQEKHIKSKTNWGQLTERMHPRSSITYLLLHGRQPFSQTFSCIVKGHNESKP